MPSLSSEELLDALTFDDVLLQPGFSEVMPADIDLSCRVAGDLSLRLPILSAAMDTVTEAQTAIVMAQEGGIGIVHRNMTAEQQALEVEKVKKYESGMVVDPVTATVASSVGDIVTIMQKHKISGVPIVEGRKLVGIVTARDLRFFNKLSAPVTEVMTKDVVTVGAGTTMDEAKKALHGRRIEKLPVVDERGDLVGLITTKDLEKSKRHPHASKDGRGQLLVGAAIGVTEEDMARAEALVDKRVDLLVLDLAHGHSKRLIDFLRRVKRTFKDLPVIAGNIATAQAATDLVAAGADAIKVGIGPGSICTTRVIAGIGVPQLTAIVECSREARRKGVPVIADGGVKFSGDAVKALAAGASAVMIGSLFAGTDESPGETILYQGRTYKSYRGMGSRGAIKQTGPGRYFAPVGEGEVEPIPEGIEGRVPYRGSLAANLHQMAGGLRAGMAYVGGANLGELQRKARFLKISSASLKESHVHDVIITQEAPNYRPSIV